jgi:hypothetical protein
MSRVADIERYLSSRRLDAGAPEHQRSLHNIAAKLANLAKSTNVAPYSRRPQLGRWLGTKLSAKH